MPKAREKLGDLPPEKDKFWKHAEYIKIRPRGGECEHYFVYKRANEVECRCGVGFFLTRPGWYLKKGKIYRDNKLVI